MGMDDLASQMNATTTMPPMPAAEIHGPSSRPTLGFPLGTALLLLVVFCLSGVFSCCYHWDKLRRLRGRIPFLPPSEASSGGDDSDGASQHSDLPSPNAKPNQQLQGALQGKEADSLPVIMPGGQIPTFIAWPCPRPPSAAPPPPPPPLLPSPPIKIVVVDVLTQQRPRTPPHQAGSLAMATSSPP